MFHEMGEYFNHQAIIKRDYLTFTKHCVLYKARSICCAENNWSHNLGPSMLSPVKTEVLLLLHLQRTSNTKGTLR